MSNLQHFEHYNDFTYSSGHGAHKGTVKAPENSRRLTEAARIENKKAKAVKILKASIIVLAFILVMQLAYHLYFAGNIVIKHLVIDTGTDLQLSESQLLKMAGLKSSQSFFSVDTAVIEQNLERYPQVQSAYAQKKFPDTLVVSVKGRTPLALCIVENGEGTLPVTVDKEGVIFQAGENVTDLNLPVLSGIKFSDAGLGVVLPGPVVSFLSGLDSLNRESPEFYNMISELKFIKKDNDDFDVLMYPQNYSIPVRIGKRIDKELLTYVVLVLDVVKTQGLESQIEELDFRTDEVVYRVRGN